MDDFDDYGDTDYDPDGRIPDLERLHNAVDCAEYASQEDFIEQGLPDLDSFTIPHLWALCGMLRHRGFHLLGKFVGYYAKHAEASVAQAIRNGDASRVGRPRPGCHRRDYMPSPLRLWGEWRAQQGNRKVWAEGWKARESTLAAKPPKPDLTMVTFLHDWNPTKPS